jgi:hypothetical protein
VHFIGLIFAASLFTLGIGAFVVTFIRYGLPVAVPRSQPFESEYDGQATVESAPAQ